jgi:DNA-binding beta-propeller fold protein YncE
VSSVKVQGSPAAVAGGFGRIWVVGHRNGVVYEIDPATARVAHTIVVGGTYYTGLAASGGFVVTARDDTKSLVKIDPKAHRVVATRRTGRSLTALTPVGDELWAIEPERNALVQIDPSTLELGNELRLPAAFGEDLTAPVADGRALWIAGDRVIAKIDLAAGKIVTRISVPGTVGSLAVADTGLFVLYPNSTAVRRLSLDGRHRKRLGFAAPQPGLARFLDGRLYVTDDKFPSVVAIDPETGRRIKTIVLRRGLPAGNQLPDTTGLVGIERSEDALWLPDWAGNKVYRVPLAKLGG